MSSYTSVDSKLLIRVDFKPTLKYFNQMFEIAASLEGEYEHWKAARNPSMGILFDPDSKRQINISGQSLSFTTKNTAVISDPFEEFSKLLVLFLSEGDVSEILRIGVRRLGIKSVNKTYAEFSDKFYETFYGSQGELKEVMADKIDDVVLILQGIKEGFQNRNQLGPLKQEQVEQLYGIEEFEGPDAIDLNKKTSIMVDTDIFSVIETDLDEGLATLKEAISVCENMHKGSWALIEDKI